MGLTWRALVTFVRYRVGRPRPAPSTAAEVRAVVLERGARVRLDGRGRLRVTGAVYLDARERRLLAGHERALRRLLAGEDGGATWPAVGDGAVAEAQRWDAAAAPRRFWD